MANKDQQVNCAMNSNGNPSKPVLNQKAPMNHNNSSYNSSKGISQFTSLPASNQAKPFRKKGYYNNNPGYSNANSYYNGNGYYHNNKFNSNMSKSQNKNLNYQRYAPHQQTSNHVDKYDSAGNSAANSVSPPSNTTASPSNLASPLSNVSPNNASSTNVLLSNQDVVVSNDLNEKQLTIDDQVKVEQPPETSVQSSVDTSSNLVRELSNLQINTTVSSKQTNEKSAPLVNHLPNQTMSFKANNSAQQTYVNHHAKSPLSPTTEPLSGGNVCPKSGSIYSTNKSVSSNHYYGNRNLAPNKPYFNNYANSNSLSSNGGYQFPNKMYSSFPRGKKSPHPNAHLLNSANSSKSPQATNQIIVPNNGGYAKMNPMTNSKMMPNMSASQGHPMIQTHPTQMITSNGYPIFYQPNVMNQHALNHSSPNPHQNLPNMHPNVPMPQNCIQCQYYNNQFVPPNTYPAQFLAFPPYHQYNTQQTVPQAIGGAGLNSNLPQQQPHRYGDDSQMKRSNQPSSNINQSTQLQTNSGPNVINSAPNKYVQQQDHIAASTHLPPAQYAYNSYMPFHAMQPNYYYQTSNAYMPGHNESQLNPHLLAQQQHQLQVSIMNNLQQQHQTNQMMNSANDYVAGNPSNVDTISNNISADNSRSNSTNYDAAGNLLSNQTGQNSLLLQTASQSNNHQQTFDTMNNGKFYSNYATNATLSDYNQMIWPQPPNLLIGNTGSNTTDDFLSSHNLTNSNKTATNSYSNDNTASSNIVPVSSVDSGLVEKK